MISIQFIDRSGIWYRYRINGLMMEFNYQPSEEKIIQIYEEYMKEVKGYESSKQAKSNQKR